MTSLRDALKRTAAGRLAMTSEEDAGLHASIVSRVRAENNASWDARLRRMFDDMHLVYAGLGACVALVVCVVGFGMMSVAASDRMPGSNQNPVVVDARMLMPRALDVGLMVAPGRDADDTAFTLSGVVTREGRILNLELYPEDGHQPVAGSKEAKLVEMLLGAVSRAQFEPAKVAGLPVAVNMVWVVAHTTVRGKEPFGVEPPPSVRKRQAMFAPAASVRKASIA
jgi:hypothetical protein